MGEISDQIRNTEKLLRSYRNNLQRIREQIASSGGPSKASIDLLNLQDTTQAEIAKLESRLNSLRIGFEQSDEQPTDSSEVFLAIDRFNRAANLEEMQRIVKEHPVLLTEIVDEAYIGTIGDIADSGDRTAAAFFTQRLEILRRLRESKSRKGESPTGTVGKKRSVDSSDVEEWAYHAMRAFGQARNPQEMQQIIEENSILLTDQMDAVYEGLITEAKKRGDVAAFRLFAEHRDILRRCREEGTERVFGK